MIGKQTLKSEFRVVSGDAGVLLLAYSAVHSEYCLINRCNVSDRYESAVSLWHHSVD